MNRMLKVSAALLVGAFFFAFIGATASGQLQKASGTGVNPSISVTFANTPTSGNFLIAIVGVGNATITTPSGWSSAINQAGTSSSPGQAIFYKVAGTSESKTVTVAVTGTSYLGLQIFEYQNVATTSSVDAINSNTGTGTAITTNSVSTSQANDLIIVGVVTNASTSFSSWTNSFTEQNDFQQTNYRTFGSASRSVTSIGSYSSGATAGLSGAWRSQIVAFKDPAPLPIQMVASAANVVRDNQVEVTWKTVSETNNYGFEIYRKRGESGDWSKVDFVQGHGTTLAPQSYSYVDASLSFGKYYYQIRQVDLDGISETFPAMEVTVGAASQTLTLAQNYPNPFNPSTLIEFVVPMSGHVTMTVYNVLGQEVATLFEGNAEAGRINTARFNASNLPSGLYFYTLRSAGQTETKRMLLTK
ncbi:MAG: T9SS type A sorting domain-containing protein [Bacteroidota bacterium]